jgi:tryptophan-rich sensory protein
MKPYLDGKVRLSHAGALGIALALPFLAAAIGGAATQRSRSGWYRRLKKPEWNPPDWLFGPVWTVLYALMGFASWLVWRRGQTAGTRKGEVKGALLIYGVHLIFNALWSVLFFGLRRLDWALVELVVLWGLILTTLVRFYRIRPLAGWLLIPYQLWTTFATLLNAMLWRLNR